MAYINMNIESKSLDLFVPVTVIYPDNKFEDLKVLYLLHGYTGNNMDWVLKSDIYKLAIEKEIVVVMPSINNSFYTDMYYGYNYFTYLTKELPEVVENIFKIKHKKENVFIAGLSMGGYGAIKAAFTYPDKYYGAASLSGVLDIKETYQNTGITNSKVIGIFGKGESFTENENVHDLFILSQNLEKEKVKLYISCGTEDFLYHQSIKFKKHLEENKIDFKYYEGPGEHNWQYWNNEIKKVLDYFF